MQIELQVSAQNTDSDQRKRYTVPMMYCYNKSRSYSVFIPNTKQKKKYNKLKHLIERKSDVGTKAYFYAYVDRKNMLHVITSKLLAMQPW